MMKDRFIGQHTIYGVDGEHATPYMTRIWIGRLRLHIFHRGDADSDPHDHPWDFWTFPLTSYVEEVVTDAEAVDCDINLLPGIALKTGFSRKRQIVRALHLHFRPATHTHRVLGRWSGRLLYDWVGRDRTDAPMPLGDPGKIITIVWQGRIRRKWGFLRNRDGMWCWTPWKEYVFGGGKHAPCERPGRAK
ncbi:hypothetical protein [Mesorhizobium sp. B1-1-7]|uniref:hypothetical protein n=1 Tax=Mesorhizobium sp. B1-1-7 TaxID=2589977 RepID=UPI00112ABD26|nr:hypothetical protein [Mesorhizobium sp. B1-1-7]TPN44892.1 hypothetical protein FJ978_28340 [Mesorhizobium sp. B1-1-7]